MDEIRCNICDCGNFEVELGYLNVINGITSKKLKDDWTSTWEGFMKLGVFPGINVMKFLL